MTFPELPNGLMKERTIEEHKVALDAVVFRLIDELTYFDG